MDYPHSVLIYCISARDNDIEYNLGGAANRLTGTVGLGDTENASGMSANVSFYGDGHLLQTVKTALGQPKKIDLKITGILRLRIVATLIQDPTDGRNGITVSVGDAQYSATS